MSEEVSTLKLQSTRFGEFEVAADSVITVIPGIIGFPNLQRYVLLDYNPPFSWLHSIEVPELAFVVVNGAEFGDTYHFALPFGDPDIDLKESDEIAVVNLVSVRPDASQTTVNLKAPVVVNLRNRRGKQIVLDNPNFPTRMPLWAAEEAAAK